MDWFKTRYLLVKVDEKAEKMAEILGTGCLEDEVAWADITIRKADVSFIAAAMEGEGNTVIQMKSGDEFVIDMPYGAALKEIANMRQ